MRALGALTGNQAVQQVRAGLQAIYVSGWQCAADANIAGQMYPDQSLYPANSVPMLVERINNALLRADQVEHAEGGAQRSWLAPIVADAEAGFGGPLNAFKLMAKGMIRAGAAGVHFEDQLILEKKKCGHLGGKVLTAQFVRTLVAARLAADVSNVPSVLIARTDANAAKLLTTDVDERDHKFITGERTHRGLLPRAGIEQAIARGLAYAPYADLVWCETSTPDLAEARRFAEAIHKEFPGKLLAYNCSRPSTGRPSSTTPPSPSSSASLGPWATSSSSSPWPASTPSTTACSSPRAATVSRTCRPTRRSSRRSSAPEDQGYTATRHQREVGTATSTPCPRPSRAASPPPSPCRRARRPNSFDVPSSTASPTSRWAHPGQARSVAHAAARAPRPRGPRPEPAGSGRRDPLASRRVRAAFSLAHRGGGERRPSRGHLAMTRLSPARRPAQSSTVLARATCPFRARHLTADLHPGATPG